MIRRRRDSESDFDGLPQPVAVTAHDVHWQVPVCNLRLTASGRLSTVTVTVPVPLAA